MTQPTPPSVIGPLLFLDHASEGRVHLAALFIAQDPAEIAPITIGDQSYAAQKIAQFQSHSVWRIRFAQPDDQGFCYDWNGQSYDVACSFAQDLRCAYVSCNGEEHGDLLRAPLERNAMWARMRTQHGQQPFALLLHGGDQVYADEVTLGHPLSEEWPDHIPKDPTREDLHSLRDHLREGFLTRYQNLYAAPDLAWLAARVPSLMQWDDHDICDGWGSLRRSRTYSPVGQLLFEVAREACLLFQHGCVDGDLPAKFADPEGDHLGWDIRLPDLHIIAPDLRGQRTRRDLMGETGWAFSQKALMAEHGSQVFLMSSVPLLGPRLSLFEMLMVLIPRMQKYEDDLRDQWQSRAHRASWIRMLTLVKEASTQRNITAVSGEIHLATRAEMRISPTRAFHQLVASGVTHRPPPRAWARLLGAVATWGEAPLKGHPIRIKPLPRQRRRYTAQRNTLTLTRTDGTWSAAWELERSGTTPLLDLASPTSSFGRRV